MSAITVFRKYAPDATQDAWVDAMQVLPFADAVEQALAGFKPDYVEGLNETHHRGDALLRYIDWTAAYTAEMHRRGYKVAGFSFATGNPGLPFPGDPNPSDAQNLIDRQWGGVDAVVWHCYWGNQGFTPYNALRFTVAHGQGPHPPFIIGECGRDALEGGQGGGKASGVSGDVYALECRAYGSVLAGLPYVLGGCVFTATPTADWQAFGVDGLNLSGAPGIGPHCILPGTTGTLAWAKAAPIVKQIDRIDVLQAAQGASPMTYDQAKAQLMAQFGWSADYAEKALAYYMAQSDFTSPDAFVGAYQQQAWRDALAGWNPRTSGGETNVASPSNDTLQTQNGLDARGEYDLAQALLAVMAGDKAKAISLLFDGAQSTFGQLNAIDPAGFPVPSRPQ